ncbi:MULTISPECIES: hypothetical protein [unclassified Paenibacillus]|uniref:hypothetical protein n=1 Tax=unclassified Paenibacillus TaxID=185978 RepID=UPI000956BDCA|nr:MULTISPECIES: hypothetical protein [unclassified Paenibacillus]ASS66643.1 J domain-containing protein [Paenibacillus sp. RUD330]SIP99921.1 hypothetical protein SAMN05880555_0266 [Paenibacillus sp. RU4X]SIQ19098.1 hypothetical protein SAMN05880570_0266 [Paenibacillus sp. RU4T]
MDTIKQAYRDLGLPDNASKEEVEKKYSLLLRRARSQQGRAGDGEAAGSPSLETINAAYRAILEHEEATAREEYNKKAYGKYKGMAGSAQKVDHFFSYYKFHLLGAIVLIAAVVYGINAYLNHKEEQAELAKLPPAALALSYFGEFGSPAGSDVKTAEQQLVSRFPDWKRVIVHLTYVPAEPMSGQDMAMVQKSVLDLITNKDDVYLMDRASFDKLASQNALLPLETHKDELGSEYNDSRALSAAAQDTPNEKHVYGVDVTDSPLVKSMGLEGGRFIAGIRSDTARLDNSLQFIRAALSDTSAP